MMFFAKFSETNIFKKIIMFIKREILGQATLHHFGENTLLPNLGKHPFWEIAKNYKH